MSTSATKPIFIIKPRTDSGITAEPRLVRAANRASAENFLLGAWEIERATVEQAVELGAKGVVIQGPSE